MEGTERADAAAPIVRLQRCLHLGGVLVEYSSADCMGAPRAPCTGAEGSQVLFGWSAARSDSVGARWKATLEPCWGLGDRHSTADTEERFGEGSAAPSPLAGWASTGGL